MFSHYFFTVFIELWPSSLLKEERMKINLVPNVSHDLKTPLTSIIRYVDVLSRAEDLSQVFRDYVRILSEKSERLNNNVSDLFCLAKSTSGNISLDLETLALKNWWNRQLLIWMTASSHRVWWLSGTFLMSRFVNVVSDRKKLYRVIQNLLDNALKYSLEGTWIFVDLHKSDGQARVQGLYYPSLKALQMYAEGGSISI